MSWAHGDPMWDLSLNHKAISFLAFSTLSEPWQKLIAEISPSYSVKLIPVTAYALFSKARWAAGDLQGKLVPEASKLVANDWKELSAAERKVRRQQCSNAPLDIVHCPIGRLIVPSCHVSFAISGDTTIYTIYLVT